MRISDWSSDVCSSDLTFVGGKHPLSVVIEGNSSDFGFRRKRLQGAGFRIEERGRAVRVRNGDAPVPRRKGEIPDFPIDRKSVVEGKRVSVRVDIGGRRIINKKNIPKQTRKGRK